MRRARALISSWREVSNPFGRFEDLEKESQFRGAAFMNGLTEKCLDILSDVEPA